MERRHRRGFWRVNAEWWDVDVDSEGHFVGYETFLRGTSTPYASEMDAIDNAIQDLLDGAWVKVEYYPGFEGVDDEG